MRIELSDKEAAALEQLQRLRRATSAQVASGVKSQTAQITKMFKNLEDAGGVMSIPDTKPVQWIITNWGIDALRRK